MMYMHAKLNACRRKVMTPEGLSDREIFQQMPLGDTWDDADLFTVFTYLWSSASTCVPESWRHTMEEFECTFRSAVVANENLVAEYNAARVNGANDMHAAG